MTILYIIGIVIMSFATVFSLIRTLALLASDNVAVFIGSFLALGTNALILFLLFAVII